MNRLILIIAVTVTVTGCHSLNGWQQGTELLNRGPVDSQVTVSQGGSGTHSAITAIQTPQGGFLVGRQGGTVTVIRTSR